MTDEKVQSIVTEAVNKSKVYGICWVLSNGEDLQTAVTEEAKENLKATGYWVAMILENGYKVDL